MAEPYRCEPGCDGGPFDTLQGLRQHILQNQAFHKDVQTYERASEVADSIIENRTRASGSNPENPQGEGGQGSADGASSGSAPEFMRLPEMEAGGDFMECPDCGEPVGTIGAKVRLVGEQDGKEVQVTTDTNDYYCDECDLIADGNGNAVRNVA